MKRTAASPDADTHVEDEESRKRRILDMNNDNKSIVEDTAKCSVCGGYIRGNPYSGSAVLFVYGRQASPEKVLVRASSAPRPDH